MQAAGDAVLVNGAAIVLVARLAGQVLGPVHVTAPVGQHLETAAHKAPFIDDQESALDRIPATHLVDVVAQIRSILVRLSPYQRLFALHLELGVCIVPERANLKYILNIYKINYGRFIILKLKIWNS